MKKILLSLAVSGLSLPALGADGSSGCGIGWYVLKDNSIVSSSLRSTTHGMVPTSFSMTSGTSNCAKHSIVDAEKRPVHFAEANFDALKVDVSAGEGEMVYAFGSTLGCRPEALSTFASTLQSRYDVLFDGSAASAEHLVIKVKEQIERSPELAKSCHTI